MDELRDDSEEVDQSPSIRRTITLRNSTARQVAVNFMPSRQLPYNTLRLRRTNSEHNALLDDETESPESDQPDSTDKQADIIVREMEQHQRLMEDNPVAEEMRREALRDLPQGLTMKRHVRAKLSASVSLRSKRRPISMWRRMKYRLSFAWKRTKDRMRDVAFSVELWYEAIRNIEGQFGSAVGSYFYFLRWLFVADLMLATAVIFFVMVPQILHDTPSSGSHSGWGIREFISGTGAYADSLLFYGHYHDGDVSSRGPLTYNMPFAYFFTMACLYLVIFGVLCYRTAYSYRRNFIETAGGFSHVFASKVFCGWDYGIVSPQAAALTATSIYNEFKELLNEQNRNNAKISACTKLCQNLTNIVINLATFGAIFGLGVGFWHLLRVTSHWAGVTSHWEILLSLTVTAAVAVLPVLFNLIVKLEYYTPRTALYVTLARTWLLDVGTLMLLLYYWTQSGNKCWETSFGQEAYRLVLLDSLVSLFILPIIEVVRGFVYKMNPSLSAPEFNIAYNSLTLIYNQAVLWFGMLFSPLLVVAVTIKLLLLFYVKRECALRACKPACKIWRAAQTQTVLYMLVTLSLFATLFGFGSLFFNMPSKECGPFRQYGYVYEVLSEGVLRLSRHPAALQVILFITRPGVIAFLILFLCVAVYFMRARALAQHTMVEILRHMLVLQAKDKDFLLGAIAKVSNGEWLYSPKPEEGPDSHTLKYLREVRKPSNAGFQLDASRLSQRPRSYADRPGSLHERRTSDGDTDSSFSWQGSSARLGDVEVAGTR
ncbi:transmembrane channel-like protein 3 [Pectinophora gossypiella]|uniref:transmembrane channel-like protein 3 n=1 Tax=Pectinophora gossypiella TaxID=13191 RepID=UPI00214E3A31|nr:transmembrane channel-like protein 3 [Pectinophora gossypiella]